MKEEKIQLKKWLQDYIVPLDKDEITWLQLDHVGIQEFLEENYIDEDGNLQSQKLLEQGKLAVISQVFSRSTSFRKYYTFNKNKLDLVIDKGLLGSKVEINTYLTSLEKIENFNLQEHNKQYFSFPIAIQKGDKLGFAETLSFDLKPYDALRPIASVILIKEDKRKEASPVDVDLSSDKINVYLNSDLYDEYRFCYIEGNLHELGHSPYL